MVCIACLLPLFLIPVVNALPLLFDFIIGKIYRLFGWEYRKHERVPPACPYKPAAQKNVEGSNETQPLVESQISATEYDKRLILSMLSFATRIILCTNIFTYGF